MLSAETFESAALSEIGGRELHGFHVARLARGMDQRKLSRAVWILDWGRPLVESYSTRRLWTWSMSFWSLARAWRR